MKKSILALALLACSSAYADRNYQGVNASYEDTGSSYITGANAALDMDDTFSFKVGVSETNYDAVNRDEFYTQDVYGTFQPHTFIRDNTSVYGLLGMSRTDMVENGDTILTSKTYITGIGIKHDVNDWMMIGSEYVWTQAARYCATTACYKAEPDESLSSTMLRGNATFGYKVRTTVNITLDTGEITTGFGGVAVGIGVGIGYAF